MKKSKEDCRCSSVIELLLSASKTLNSVLGGLELSETDILPRPVWLPGTGGKNRVGFELSATETPLPTPPFPRVPDPCEPKREGASSPALTPLQATPRPTHPAKFRPWPHPQHFPSTVRPRRVVRPGKRTMNFLSFGRPGLLSECLSPSPSLCVCLLPPLPVPPVCPSVSLRT